MATTSDRAKAPKNIFLFSDGTGNSSAKLQKTNVWRLYEALDLGPPRPPAGSGPASPAQIAYYDNGVGTSAVPLLAAFGGIFGWGLARNVRGLYKFLCRNYHPGDRIFAFGFSRGAFTIRVLVSLITRMGVISTQGETDLDLQTHDVWRQYRRAYLPYRFGLFVRAFRALVRVLTEQKRYLLDQRPYAAALREEKDIQRPDIEFLGVWDTVAAYGGPVVEVTRAIDLMIWPLSMNDYGLSQKVMCARHALALDDRRDSFIPLPWDEIYEQSLVAAGTVAADRLQQVWFAGMHSDVGGGYSDETLSFVSLTWMIDGAHHKGARLIPEFDHRIRTMANSLGPIHDSRRGLGMFYRFQRRPIEAWLNPSAPSSWIFLDPSVKRGALGSQTNAIGSDAQGLLAPPLKVHCSVVERLRRGTDCYSPINLPQAFDVISGNDVIERIDDPDRGAVVEGWIAARVARRRTHYFAAITVLLLMLSMPLWSLRDDGSWGALGRWIRMQADARDLAGPIYGFVSGILPNFTHYWTDAWAAKFWLTLILALSFAMFVALGSSIERNLADMNSLLFRNPGAAPVLRANRLHRWLAQNAAVQKAVAAWKWYVVPSALGVLLFVMALFLGVASLTQLFLFWTEGSACDSVAKYPRLGPDPRLPAAASPIKFTYRIDSACVATKVWVVKDQTYSVELEKAKWTDAGIATTPTGHSRHGISELFVDGFAPFRRVIRAPYFAPIAEIRTRDGAAHLQRIWQRSYDGKKFLGEFKAERDGEFIFFVNDAVFPVDWKSGDWLDLAWLHRPGRYRNNAFVSGQTSGQGRIWSGLPQIAVTAPSTAPPANNGTPQAAPLGTTPRAVD